MYSQSIPLGCRGIPPRWSRGLQEDKFIDVVANFTYTGLDRKENWKLPHVDLSVFWSAVCFEWNQHSPLGLGFTRYIEICVKKKCVGAPQSCYKYKVSHSATVNRSSWPYGGNGIAILPNGSSAYPVEHWPARGKAAVQTIYARVPWPALQLVTQGVQRSWTTCITGPMLSMTHVTFTTWMILL
jgi:hypothetical protein